MESRWKWEEEEGLAERHVHQEIPRMMSRTQKIDVDAAKEEIAVTNLQRWSTTNRSSDTSTIRSRTPRLLILGSTLVLPRRISGNGLGCVKITSHCDRLNSRRKTQKSCGPDSRRRIVPRQ